MNSTAIRARLVFLVTGYTPQPERPHSPYDIFRRRGYHHVHCRFCGLDLTHDSDVEIFRCTCKGARRHYRIERQETYAFFKKDAIDRARLFRKYPERSQPFQFDGETYDDDWLPSRKVFRDNYAFDGYQPGADDDIL